MKLRIRPVVGTYPNHHFWCLEVKRFLFWHSIVESDSVTIRELKNHLLLPSKTYTRKNNKEDE